MQNELIRLCEKYLRDIAFAAKISSLAGVAVYCSANTERIDTHEAICELLEVDHFDERIKKITDNLNDSIGFCFDEEYSDLEFEKLAKTLAEKLMEARKWQKKGEVYGKTNNYWLRWISRSFQQKL